MFLEIMLSPNCLATILHIDIDCPSLIFPAQHNSTLNRSTSSFQNGPPSDLWPYDLWPSDLLTSGLLTSDLPTFQLCSDQRHWSAVLRIGIPRGRCCFRLPGERRYRPHRARLSWLSLADPGRTLAAHQSHPVGLRGGVWIRLLLDPRFEWRRDSQNSGRYADWYALPQVRDHPWEARHQGDDCLRRSSTGESRLRVDN